MDNQQQQQLSFENPFLMSKDFYYVIRAGVFRELNKKGRNDISADYFVVSVLMRTQCC